MEKIVSSRLEEIGHCLQNDDLNRASRRMIDFVYDFSCHESLSTKALDLRKAYNQAKELGSNAVSNNELAVELMSFFEKNLCVAEISLPDASTKGALLAKAKELSKKYESRLHNFYLEPIDLDLVAGEIIGLVGENGNGKTTLLRMLAGSLCPNSGSFKIFAGGQTVEKWEEIRPNIAFIPQRIQRWFGTAEENLSFEAAIKGVPVGENKAQVDYVINQIE